MAEIRMDHLGKSYPGGVVAVRDVTLDIPDGEFTVLVGPSGCGKSTLLRMVAGLETITTGRLEIGGRDVGKLEPADRDIAMVFQNYALYPHMTVYDNLAYGLRNRRTPKAEIEWRVHKAAAMLEIEPFLARKPKALSGGQRQRVAMGRALVREPAAFLFDEPLSNLDAKLRVQMRVEIRQLQRQLGTTSLYVTHDQHEAMTLADRLVVLNGGRIEQQGTPMTIYDRPDSLFVAGFIGSPGMNLLDLSVIRAGVSAEVRFPPGTDIVGVRPEDLTTIVPEVPCVTIDGRVELFEPLGHEALLYLSVPGLRSAVVALTGVRDLVAPGTTVRLFARCDAVHPFDSTTGRRTD